MQQNLTNAVETNRFKLEELFFSRTDTRGVIRSANEVFRHVSFMEWDELLGAPHKVVRHPQMPRAVFRLMWSTLQSGKPIGAYIVNKAKDDTCYWVFAVVMPIDDGYLSLRLKPVSTRLEQIKALYTDLRAAEDSGDMSVEESEARLLDATIGSDYTDYDDFMTDALSGEMMARAEGLERGRVTSLDALKKIQTAVQSVGQDAQTVGALFERSRQIPFNMRLQAVKIEGREGPISVISGNHQTMTQNLDEQVRKLRTAAELGAGPIQETRFYTGTMLLMEEVRQQFDQETTTDKERRAADQDALAVLYTQYSEQAKAAVFRTAERASDLANLCKTFRRALSALEMTRIMCNIEQSKLSGDTAGLNDIASQLLSIEKDLSKVLARIEASVSEILAAAELLQGGSRKAA
ncbi:hypothetical protein [uncultured Roseobacter sp.]|uniref:hypothetical protein n=1 Tax=uncultured Roseobacter sp. TaxID=114847 RepID=UPI00261642D6|nr:hypothetical protein [uncultured Roseobacter sp.]